MDLGNSPRHLRVVLIHHGDETRLPDARRTASTMLDLLSEFGSTDVEEIWRQPEYSPLPSALIARRLVGQWQLERDWAAYLGVGRRWVLSSGLLTARLLGLLLPRRRTRHSRRMFIELCLSDKHRLAWQRAVADDVDLLVVIEDDARLKPDTVLRMRALLPHLLEQDSDAATYVDLAGGLDRRELRVRHVETPGVAGTIRLSKPATNTTCAYVVDRSLMRMLVDHNQDVGHGYVPPSDWLINRAFMDTDGGTSVICLHTEPPVLSHGSLEGLVLSSIR
jgi:hypothetical protein